MECLKPPKKNTNTRETFSIYFWDLKLSKQTNKQSSKRRDKMINVGLKEWEVLFSEVDEEDSFLGLMLYPPQQIEPIHIDRYN